MFSGTRTKLQVLFPDIEGAAELKQEQRRGATLHFRHGR